MKLLRTQKASVAIGLLSIVYTAVHSAKAAETVASFTTNGWTALSPREEIRPDFSVSKEGRHPGGESLVIEHNEREGLVGRWSKSFPVEGGRYYQFQVFQRVENVPTPRSSAIIQMTWEDGAGTQVWNDQPVVDYYRGGGKVKSNQEYPISERDAGDGWAEISGTYRAPETATQTTVDLFLKWAPRGKVEWTEVSLKAVEKPAERKVRLASVHFQPKGGKTPDENCRMFAPLIADAARQKADLVVLPETLTYYGLKKSYADVAEPIPGPSTEYFGTLAKQHDLYLVVGLCERAEHLVYNVAVLIGPDGKIVGKYRKVCLPASESEGGIAPGHEYPVFETRFGKVGMMVCYDGFFPEVARELTKGGAEVIAWPVWGCNPLLARARATENQVYLVSSTYTPADTDWIISAVFDHTGETLVSAQNFGEVVVTEVDLGKPTLWAGLGDFKAQMIRRRPEAPSGRPHAK
ncbi:MAG: carbon-nitrogen hydrolase family protein [Verrucomicrobiales bacterium]|jgi:predicted amidohydrolase|nr:carbon-nitrogen hydrolase family protein [Verrucomicrobiales bacterium]MBP9223877.1 carbon-nitrogen hydrolase family protein [Verrucomicrobiales bacterium]